MRKTAHVERRFENEHRILDKLADLLPVGQPTPGMSYPALAEKIGEQASTVLQAKQTMEAAGILKIKLEYPKGRSGRVSVWEMTMPRVQAHEELSREHERQVQRPSNKARRRMARVESGDLPNVRLPRLDESRQVVESVRSYVKRMEWARHHLNEMRQAGIDVDPSSIKVQRDEKLENVALVLPVIEELERKAERAEDQAARWREMLNNGK